MTRAPDRIGPYEILGVLGRGGMGVVYHAAQHEPLHREVALKTVAEGLDAEKILQRFDAERQVLARMNHPSIANVYDAGFTEDGVPYFAMEYVNGPSLIEYCDSRGLEIEERIKLFSQACEAVFHAHQKGILHRDLKPSNILVAEVDGVPLCKLIDFGIAKAIEASDEDRAQLTHAEEIVGTLAYLSPEQIEGNADIDVRTDVYSLGLVLYELLVGALPHEPESYRNWVAVAASQTEDPPTLSKRLLTLDDVLAVVAEARSTTPSDLRKQLSGEPAWIVAKALERERDRRYETPLALAEDLERHLRNEPVVAGPPSAAYRARKFIRRHRAGVMGAAAVAVALVGGIISTSVGLVRAREAEARAQEEAATANQVSDFMVGLFQAGNPGGQEGNQVSAREILDRGVEEIETGLQGQPAIQGRLLLTMGRAYFGIGFWERAEELVRRSVNLREEAHGPEHPAVAESLSELAELIPYNAPDRSSPFENPEILAVAERARAIRTDHLEEDTLAWLYSVGHVASLYERVGRLEDGEALLNEHIELMRKDYGEGHERVRILQNGLAQRYVNAERMADAAKIWEALLAASKGGIEWPAEEEETVRGNLALVYGALDRGDEAVVLYEEVLASWRTRNPEDRSNIEPILWNLALAYSEVDRWADAAGAWQDLVTAMEEVYGPQDHHLAGYLNNLAYSQIEMEAYEEAETNLIRSLEVSSAAEADPRLGDQPWQQIHDSAWPYGLLLARTGRPDAVSTLVGFAGGDPRREADLLDVVAMAFEEEGSLEGALELRNRVIQRTLAATQASEDPDVGRLRDAFINYAVGLLMTDDAEGLISLGPRWVSVMERFSSDLGMDPVLQAHRDMASHLFRGEPTRDVPPIPRVRGAALTHLRKALEIREGMVGVRGSTDPVLLQHLAPLEHALRLEGRTGEADGVHARSARILDAQIVSMENAISAGEEVLSARWNSLCWWGGLNGHGARALLACDAAVGAASSEDLPGHRDSRGLVRVQMGDFPGAVEDFEAYVAARSPDHPTASQRRIWIEALRNGENPISLEVLSMMSF